MKLSILSSATLAAAATAADIAFAGNYGGSIDTLSFDTKAGVFKRVSSTKDSSPAPSWQEISADRKFLYTVEESSHDDASRGAVTSFSIADDGKLEKVKTALGPAGPVSLAISPDQKLIFTANYNDPKTGDVSWLRDWSFKLSSPGKVPDRQDASHPHQALFDPSGKFIVVPDLGADLLRIFSVSSDTEAQTDSDSITELESVPTEPGTGPRHGLFYPPTGEARFYFVVGELSNTITAFSVSYTKDTLKLEQIHSLSTLPDDYQHDRSVPAAGEILLVPGPSDPAAEAKKEFENFKRDGEKDKGTFIMVSNRLDQVYKDKGNSIASYAVDTNSGKLSLQSIFPAHVNNTRHFTAHPNGKWLVTEGVYSNDIVALPLDAKVGQVVGDAKEGFEMDQPVCLTWL